MEIRETPLDQEKDKSHTHHSKGQEGWPKEAQAGQLHLSHSEIHRASASERHSLTYEGGKAKHGLGKALVKAGYRRIKSWRVICLLKNKNNWLRKRAEGIKAGSLQSDWVDYWMDEKLTEALSSEAEVQWSVTQEVGEKWSSSEVCTETN